jgi:hypothetical protein
MNNTGSSKPAAVGVTSPDDHIRIPLKVLILGFVAVALALIIGSQVIGVLYGILFPPSPPLPGNVAEILHDNPSYGVDDWLYNAADKPCDVVSFYQSQGGNCRVAPFWCGDDREADPTQPGFETRHQNVARCTGNVPFSIFTMHWQVTIATGDSQQFPTLFRLSREVYWSS